MFYNSKHKIKVKIKNKFTGLGFEKFGLSKITT